MLKYSLKFSKEYVSFNKKQLKFKEQVYIRKKHSFDFNDKTTIRELFIEITNNLISFYTKNSEDKSDYYSDSYLADLHRIIINGKSLLVLNLDAKISQYVKEYGNNISVFLMATRERGADIWRENGIRYYMHSNENTKHNEPHIHVKFGEYSASVRISDGKILAGELPKNKRKQIINRILCSKDELLFCWNTKTKGVKVEISDEQLFYL